MANTPNATCEPKYGAQNLSSIMEGTDLVIRLDTRYILAGKAKGDPMPDPKRGIDPQTGEVFTKPRPTNLVSSSGGFTSVGPVRLSLNVTG